MAKPNQTTPGVIIPGGSIRPANATNFILKGKAIPLVLEKNKNPVQNCNDLVMTTTGEYKAMKLSPLLRPFCGSEFWGFSLLKI